MSRKRYTDKFKSTALIMLESQGYPKNPYKLAEVARHLNVTDRTLRRWYNDEYGAPSVNTVAETKKDMVASLQEIAYKLIGHMLDDEVIAEMSGQQTATSLGIIIDKMRLLMGLPTEIISIMPQVVAAIERTGQTPQEVFNRLIERANHYVDAE